VGWLEYFTQLHGFDNVVALEFLQNLCNEVTIVKGKQIPVNEMIMVEVTCLSTVGLCCILSRVTHVVNRGVRRWAETPLCCVDCVVGEVTGVLRGVGNPTIWGPGQRPGKFWFWTLF